MKNDEAICHFNYYIKLGSVWHLKLQFNLIQLSWTSIIKGVQKKKKKESGVQIKDNYYTLTPRQAAFRFPVSQNESLRWNEGGADKKETESLVSLFILFAVSQLKQSTKEGYFNFQGNLEGKHILFYLKLIFIWI